MTVTAQRVITVINALAAGFEIIVRDPTVMYHIHTQLLQFAQQQFSYTSYQCFAGHEPYAHQRDRTTTKRGDEPVKDLLHERRHERLLLDVRLHNNWFEYSPPRAVSFFEADMNGVNGRIIRCAHSSRMRMPASTALSWPRRARHHAIAYPAPPPASVVSVQVTSCCAMGFMGAPIIDEYVRCHRFLIRESARRRGRCQSVVSAAGVSAAGVSGCQMACRVRVPGGGLCRHPGCSMRPVPSGSVFHPVRVNPSRVACHRRV